MSMKTHQFLAHTRLDGDALEICLTEGWLLPDRQAGEPTFSDADIARAQLIQDLRHGLGVNDEGIGVVLNLIDQLHGLRSTLRHLLTGLEAAPQDAREHLVDVLRGATRAP
jgi:chaperone modulatory protein CbpM